MSFALSPVCFEVAGVDDFVLLAPPPEDADPPPPPPVPPTDGAEGALGAEGVDVGDGFEDPVVFAPEPAPASFAPTNPPAAPNPKIPAPFAIPGSAAFAFEATSFTF